MRSKRIVRPLLGAAIMAGGLELIARTIAPCPRTRSEPGGDGSPGWKLERTAGVRRIAVTGDVAPWLVRDLSEHVRNAEVLDMTAAPLDRAIAAAARYRPDLVVHGVA